MNTSLEHKEKFDKEFYTLHDEKGCNYGFLMDSIPDEIISEFNHIESYIKSNFDSAERFNYELAGVIEKEYKVEFSKNIKDYIIQLVHFYESKSKGLLKQRMLNIPAKNNADFIRNNEGKQLSNFSIPKLCFDQPWVNFQKKYEYNPLHDHRGVISLVVWHRIPFTNEEEDNYAKSKGYNLEQTSNGAFNFVTSNNGISQHSLRIDKNMQGSIALFPSDLFHFVNPFYTSDEYRVTFSCNLLYKDLTTKFEFVD